MSKILDGYNNYIISKGTSKTIKDMNNNDLEEMNNLKELLVLEGIYSISGYDDYINYLCDSFQIELCYTCENHIFLKDLDSCERCEAYICNTCKPSCICFDTPFC